MDLPEVTNVTAAIKATFETVRTAIAMAKEATELLPEGEQKNSAQQAFREAEKAAKINEAQIAQALGYHLCHCEFPPQIMFKVGAMGRAPNIGKPVYECPVCNQNTAAPFSFNRCVPRRDAE